MIVNFTGLSDNRIAPVAADMQRKTKGQALIVTASTTRARRIATDLAFFSDAEILVVPDVETASFKYEAKSSAELSERLRVLTTLCSGKEAIVVAPALGALKRLAPPESFLSNAFSLQPGQCMDRKDLIDRLSRMGYERVNQTEALTQFSVRGDIVDIFAPGSENPVRVEFFDDEVDSIRSFDPLTQRSLENLDRLDVYPAHLLVKEKGVYESALKKITAAYNKACSGRITREALDKLRERRDYLIDCIEEGINPQYLEGYISYFYDEPSFLWDYLKNPAFVMVDDPARVADALDFYEKEEGANEAQALERFLAVKDDFKSHPDSADFWKLNEIETALGTYYCTPFTEQIRFTRALDEIRPFNTRQAPVYSGHMDVLETDLNRYVKDGYRVTIACSTVDRYINLRDFVSRIGLEGKVVLKEGSLAQGTEYIKEKELYLAESDIFASAKQARKHRGKNREIKAFTDIKKGDFVVHEAHGVGRFAGVERLTVDGATRDYLKIQYAGADVLYVPVDQMETIQKYVGSEGVEPKVYKLNGADWQATKAKAKAAIWDMAEDFLRLSAERSIAPGYQFGPDTTWQKEFEDAFPYVETEDQLRCVKEIKKDMQSPSAMDRLLCGDVGYGKTEVAARAIFKCLEAGKQAAVLVPTTILANQHYHTFLERFAAYPFNIEMLCRFRTESQQEDIVKKLKTGEVDLIVGTHRILSKDVEFKDLGLLVIDEEQRFGVEHKDAIKKLKANVDVLTLSATPIPRTLHMSLIGVRNMSVIEEPPGDRYPVQTYVMEQDDDMIADAIRRELGRGGQVYIVYNRVKSIHVMARKIQELVPEAKIAVGHGQMSERALEDVMMAFTEGEYQVLLATTIIESGLDIPNVNTLIVLDADRFGLSQLYQLRGRVGRSSRMAYAYLVYKKDKVLSELAEKRLRAIREFTEFGSGFRVAMRDLELRGAGNILGKEQSGHMLSIGYELYCKLVAEAVAELKGEAPEDRPPEADTQVELGISAFLPEYYVSDELTRLDLYKRIAAISSADARMEMVDELLDRFGDLPPEADNLLDIALIRNLSSHLGVSRVVRQQTKILFIFEQNNALGPEIFARLMDAYGPGLTIYGGVEPRITLVIRKKSPAQTAIDMLQLCKNDV